MLCRLTFWLLADLCFLDPGRFKKEYLQICLGKIIKRATVDAAAKDANLVYWKWGFFKLLRFRWNFPWLLGVNIYPCRCWCCCRCFIFFIFIALLKKKLLFRKLIASDVEIASPVVHKLTQFMHKLMRKIDDFKKNVMTMCTCGLLLFCLSSFDPFTSWGSCICLKFSFHYPFWVQVEASGMQPWNFQPPTFF